MSVQRAREAAARGSWEEAYDLLMEADADGLADPGDLRLLGTLSYLTPLASTTVLVLAGRASPSWRLAAACALIVGGALIAARSGGANKTTRGETQDEPAPGPIHR